MAAFFEADIAIGTHSANDIYVFLEHTLRT